MCLSAGFSLPRGESPVVYHTAVRNKALRCNRVSWKSHKQRAAPLMHIRHWNIFENMQQTFSEYSEPWWSLWFKCPQPTPTVTIFQMEKIKGISSLCRNLTDTAPNSLFRIPCTWLLPPVSTPNSNLKIYSPCCIFSGSSSMQGDAIDAWGCTSLRSYHLLRLLFLLFWINRINLWCFTLYPNWPVVIADLHTIEFPKYWWELTP